MPMLLTSCATVACLLTLDKSDVHPYTVVNDYENDTGIAFNGREKRLARKPIHMTRESCCVTYVRHLAEKQVCE